jgi:hypothetical protein
MVLLRGGVEWVGWAAAAVDGASSMARLFTITPSELPATAGDPTTAFTRSIDI